MNDFLIEKKQEVFDKSIDSMGCIFVFWFIKCPTLPSDEHLERLEDSTGSPVMVHYYD